MKKTYRIVLEAVDKHHFNYGGCPTLHKTNYTSLAQAIKATRYLTTPLAKGIDVLASVFVDGVGKAVGFRYSGEGFRRLW